MYLTYGTFTHPLNEISMTRQRTRMFNDAHREFRFKENVRIKGLIIVSDPSTLISTIQTLVNAYSIQAQDVGLFYDNGTPTDFVASNSSVLGGVRVVSGPNFPKGDGADYVDRREYDLELEAEFIVAGVNLLSWMETVDFTGAGGPIFKHMPTINGLWQKQTVAQNSLFSCVQKGSAVGYFGYPVPPAPLFPDAFQPEKSTPLTGSKGMPEFYRDTYVKFPVNWSFNFESNTPLSGDPHPWPNP